LGDPCETLARNGFHPATPLYAASKLVSSLTSSMQHNHHRIIPVIFRKLSHSLFCFSSQNYGKKLNYIAHSFYYTARFSHHSHSFDIMDIPFFLFFFFLSFFFERWKSAVNISPAILEMDSIPGYCIAIIIAISYNTLYCTKVFQKFRKDESCFYLNNFLIFIYLIIC